MRKNEEERYRKKREKERMRREEKDGKRFSLERIKISRKHD